MLGSKGHYSQLSLFNSCETLTGKFSPFITPDEGLFVNISCENPYGENIITCRHPHIDEFLEEVNGLDLNLNIKNSYLQEVPDYIPVIDKNVSYGFLLPENMNLVGISLNDIFTGAIHNKAGSLHAGNRPHLKYSILKNPAIAKKGVILFSSGSDTLIESIWHKRDRIKYFEIVSRMGFTVATGFNFSLFNGECPFAHALNMKKSLLSSSLYQQHKVLAIPHIYALTSEQLNRWAEWLAMNPEIQYYTVNCQMQRSDDDINQVIEATRLLLSRFSHLHVIMQGFRFKYLDELGSDIQRIHFADASSIKKSIGHQKFEFNPETKEFKWVEKSSLTVPELIMQNSINRAAVIDYYKRKSITIENDKRLSA